MNAMHELLERVRQQAESPSSKKLAEERAAEERRYDERDLAGGQAKLLGSVELPALSVECLERGGQDTAAMQALAGDVGLVVLSGAPGCGKTVAAVAWIRSFVLDPANWSKRGTLNHHFDRGPAPVFASAAKLSRWGRYDDAAMGKLLRASRLVVDDMGTEYLDEKGAYLSLLDELINERYANKRPTVITSNLDAAAFKSRYGERVIDRIREVGRFVSLAGKSMRRKP